jgi:catechol 2,3-dioxygenase-like lactoylglutathione lyase family enzyme
VKVASRDEAHGALRRRGRHDRLEHGGRARGTLVAEVGGTVRISLSAIFVNDQPRAEQFYVNVLGFEVAEDFPVGSRRWITVVSREEPDGAQLVLEPDDHPAARAFCAAIKSDGIPATSFLVDDVVAEYKRLAGLGVTFTVTPEAIGGNMIAVLDDTCGNLIQLTQVGGGR